MGEDGTEAAPRGAPDDRRQRGDEEDEPDGGRDLQGPRHGRCATSPPERAAAELLLATPHEELNPAASKTCRPEAEVTASTNSLASDGLAALVRVAIG